LKRRLLIGSVCLMLVIAAVAILPGCGGKKAIQLRSARELFEQGKAKLEKKKYYSAIELFQQVVYNYPGEPIIDTVQYYLALAYFSDEQYAVASVEFNRLVANYPLSAYVVQSEFMKAVATFESTPDNAGLDQTELDEGIRQLEDFIAEHPESPQASDANKFLDSAKTRMAKKYYSSAVVYSRIGVSKSAKIYYQKVIDDYTNSIYAPLATFNLAIEEMNLKAYDEARKRFDNFVIVYPNHALVPNAKQKAVESAFQAAVVEMNKPDKGSAKEKFEAFIKEFPGDKRVSKANRYLAEIATQQPSN
jgi:outer membrane protein assembly factor BamD